MILPDIFQAAKCHALFFMGSGFGPMHIIVFLWEGRMIGSQTFKVCNDWNHGCAGNTGAMIVHSAWSAMIFWITLGMSAYGGLA